MILITYPDRICYHPGCDDRECRVLFPEGVRIRERATCPLGESGWSCSAAIPPGCIISGIWLRRHSTRMSHIRNSSPSTFHPDISHSALDAGWERRAFQLPRSDISGSSDSAYPGSFAAIFAQCRGVLLKLPDICDRHFEIFCFRYLMSKSVLLKLPDICHRLS